MQIWWEETLAELLPPVCLGIPKCLLGFPECAAAGEWRPVSWPYPFEGRLSESEAARSPLRVDKPRAYDLCARSKLAQGFSRTCLHSSILFILVVTLHYYIIHSAQSSRLSGTNGVDRAPSPLYEHPNGCSRRRKISIVSASIIKRV